MTEAINPNYMYLGTMTLTYLEALEDKIDQKQIFSFGELVLHQYGVRWVESSYESSQGPG